MSSKFVWMSVKMWNMSARLAVWTSSSACYRLCPEFWGHYFTFCSTCTRQQTVLNLFNIYTILFLFCSAFLRHCDCDWAVLFSSLYFITSLISDHLLAAFPSIYSFCICFDPLKGHSDYFLWEPTNEWTTKS